MCANKPILQMRQPNKVFFSLSELKKFVEQPNSSVSCVTSKRSIGLMPMHLKNLSSSIKELLNAKVKKYDVELQGVILAHKNVKVNAQSIHLGDSRSCPLEYTADIYVFKPVVGSVLTGVVNKLPANHEYLSVLVHNMFNVTVHSSHSKPLPKSSCRIGAVVSVVVTFVDFTGRLPYIKGTLCPSENTHEVEQNVSANLQIEKTLGTSKMITECNSILKSSSVEPSDSSVNVQSPKKKKKKKEKDVSEVSLKRKRDSDNDSSEAHKKKKKHKNEVSRSEVKLELSLQSERTTTTMDSLRVNQQSESFERTINAFERKPKKEVGQSDSAISSCDTDTSSSKKKKKDAVLKIDHSTEANGEKIKLEADHDATRLILPALIKQATNTSLRATQLSPYSSENTTDATFKKQKYKKTKEDVATSLKRKRSTDSDSSDMHKTKKKHKIKGVDNNGVFIPTLPPQTEPAAVTKDGHLLITQQPKNESLEKGNVINCSSPLAIDASLKKKKKTKKKEAHSVEDVTTLLLQEALKSLK